MTPGWAQVFPANEQQVFPSVPPTSPQDLITLVDTFLGMGVHINYDLALAYWELSYMVNFTDNSTHAMAHESVNEMLNCFSEHTLGQLSNVFISDNYNVLDTVPWDKVAEKLDFLCGKMGLPYSLRAPRQHQHTFREQLGPVRDPLHFKVKQLLIEGV